MELYRMAGPETYGGQPMAGGYGGPEGTLTPYPPDPSLRPYPPPPVFELMRSRYETARMVTVIVVVLFTMPLMIGGLYSTFFFFYFFRLLLPNVASGLVFLAFYRRTIYLYPEGSMRSVAFDVLITIFIWFLLVLAVIRVYFTFFFPIVTAAIIYQYMRMRFPLYSHEFGWLPSAEPPPGPVPIMPVGQVSTTIYCSNCGSVMTGDLCDRCGALRRGGRGGS